MTLELGALSKQIRQMGEAARANARADESYLRQALDVLRESARDIPALNAKIEGSRSYWPAARPVEPLNSRFQAWQTPSDYVVIASDGSQIEPDRHGAALCYLINVGVAALRYGDSPHALLRSAPKLHYSEDDLYIVSNNRRILIQGHLLAVKRSIAETDALAEVARELENQGSLVCLQDGTLALQTLEGWGLEDQLREELTQQFLRRLDDLRGLQVPLGSYISRPRSGEVVGLLRVSACPYSTANCDQHCRESVPANTQPCAWLGGLADRFIFRALPLQEGERSALFLASSAISRQRYLENKVHFFFLNVGREIARVEVPQWVARDSTALSTVQAIIIDQCRRGGGYPRALSEAHEKAVVSAGDRDNFWRLVEAALIGARVSTAPSEKAKSKRLRGV